MSARSPNTKAARKAGRERRPAALYVYCVGAREELAPLVEGAGVAPIETGAGVELVEGGGLAAVVSDVPLADYGEDALRERLQDPAWMATRAMRHEAAVEHFARRAAVVPLRFGTIYLSRESVEKMLAERGAQLRSIIDRVEGREEWGVNVYADRAKTREAVARVSPRLLEMDEQAARSTPGQAYLLRKKIDALRADEARAETKRAAAEIEDALASACDGAARLRVLKDEASEHGDLAAKLAFLVQRDAFEGFRAEAERLAQKFAPLGLRLELTGPWPAYNFVVFDEKEEGGKGEEAKRGKGEEAKRRRGEVEG